jgi:hypothetical protein
MENQQSRFRWHGVRAKVGDDLSFLSETTRQLRPGLRRSDCEKQSPQRRLMSRQIQCAGDRKWPAGAAGERNRCPQAGRPVPDGRQRPLFRWLDRRTTVESLSSSRGICTTIGNLAGKPMT